MSLVCSLTLTLLSMSSIPPSGSSLFFHIIGSTFRPNPHLSKLPSVPSTLGYQLESIRNWATMQPYNATWRDEIKCNLRHRKEFESFGWHPPPSYQCRGFGNSCWRALQKALAFLARINASPAQFCRELHVGSPNAKIDFAPAFWDLTIGFPRLQMRSISYIYKDLILEP